MTSKELTALIAEKTETVPYCFCQMCRLYPVTPDEYYALHPEVKDERV
jgi:hypothetical protein